ncbi:MAG TPA: hypothetical protein VFY71_01545 [Planctomycetota bacterium]|nr:hypothetical protein [Planctomycetota bacterium]
MASVLKQISGIDPFTIFAPTMSERRTHAEEEPLSRDATARGLVSEPTIFGGADGAPFGSGNCDAYLFWPRVELVQGRPDRMVKVLRRQVVEVPPALLGGEGLRLVQAVPAGEPFSHVAADQALLRPGEAVPALMLGKGQYSVRVIDAKGHVEGPVNVDVR